MTSENVRCLPCDSRHLEQCLAHSGYSTVVVKWTKRRMKMKRKRAQENSEENYTCITSWTSSSKAFICSKEEDGTDQKRRYGQSPALPSCIPCWGTGVPWAICPTLWHLCVAISALPPGEICGYQEEVCWFPGLFMLKAFVILLH